MENRPGKHRNNSKLTEKYHAGRGRALKDLSRRSPKAEEVERRKQVQQLILSGQLRLDQETFDKYLLSSDKNGSRSGSASSSSSQQQLYDSESDSCTDLTVVKNSSKVPVGSTKWQEELQSNTLLNNNLENNVAKLNISEESKYAGSDNNNIPPRFRNSQWSNNFKKNKPRPSRPIKQNGHKGQIEMEATWQPGKFEQPREQKPLNVAAKEFTSQNHATSSDAWNDWENSVVVHAAGIEDEDFEDLVVVDDNDTIDDVMVQQYVNALHQEQQNGATNANSKITPSRIQELSNLKSTTNADSLKVPPGTVPNPPKGPDRWGGKELKNIEEPTGWGDIEETGNWYDDGSNLWSNPTLPYAASGGWSWNS